MFVLACKQEDACSAQEDDMPMSGKFCRNGQVVSQRVREDRLKKEGERLRGGPLVSAPA
jgi:hypothetical protein